MRIVSFLEIMFKNIEKKLAEIIFQSKFISSFCETEFSVGVIYQWGYCFENIDKISGIWRYANYYKIILSLRKLFSFIYCDDVFVTLKNQFLSYWWGFIYIFLSLSLF